MAGTPFGVPWNVLELAHLRAFFGEGTLESLTVEAKGAGARCEHVRRTVCAFANSPLGGYLVLGVAQDQGQWTFEGIDVRDEPHVWVANCLADGGVEPRPWFDVRNWPAASGAVAVVWVRPVAIPPCVTNRGEVYERVPGRNVLITTPHDLHRLFDKGSAAQSRAWSESRAGRDDLAATNVGNRRLVVILSVASPALASDVSALAFRESTSDEIVRILRERLPFELPFLQRSGAEIDQHALTRWSYGSEEGEGYTVRIRRGGSIAVGWADPDLNSPAERVARQGDELLGRLWRAAADLARHLGAVGPIHVAVRLSPPDRAPTDIDCWAELEGEPPLESIRREAVRSTGIAEWEPEE